MQADLATSYHAEGLEHLANGKPGKAETALLRAAKIRETRLAKPIDRDASEDAGKLAATYKALARVYQRKGDTANALGVYTKVGCIGGHKPSPCN
jgi:hypothetical protein